VRDYAVTPANVHDRPVFDEVIDPDTVDPEVWTDSAYRSEETEAVLQHAEYVSHLHEQGRKDRPLTEAQKRRNRERARVRSRVEPVVGCQHNRMGGQWIRTIGLARAKIKMGLMNLTYNLMRSLQISRREGGGPAAT